MASGATVIIDYSAFAFGATQYLQKQGVPVVASGFDCPEWAEQPNTNMFAWSPPSESPVNGTLCTWDSLGRLLKGLGVTKFGGLDYGISPSSTAAIIESEKAAQSQGIGICYTNNSVPFGAPGFTADVLPDQALRLQRDRQRVLRGVGPGVEHGHEAGGAGQRQAVLLHRL